MMMMIIDLFLIKIDLFEFDATKSKSYLNLKSRWGSQVG